MIDSQRTPLRSSTPPGACWMSETNRLVSSPRELSNLFDPPGVRFDPPGVVSRRTVGLLAVLLAALRSTGGVLLGTTRWPLVPSCEGEEYAPSTLNFCRVGVPSGVASDNDVIVDSRLVHGESESIGDTGNDSTSQPVDREVGSASRYSQQDSHPRHVTLTHQRHSHFR